MQITEKLFNEVKSVQRSSWKQNYDVPPEVVAVRCALSNTYGVFPTVTMEESIKLAKAFLEDGAVPTTLYRNEYGTLVERIPGFITNPEDVALLRSKQVIIQKAADEKLIPPTEERMQYGHYKGICREYGYALRHDIMDFTDNEVLMCVRVVNSDKKGRSNIKKDYFIITQTGEGVVVNPARKSMVARSAKSTNRVLGAVIARCRLPAAAISAAVGGGAK